jgi:hypothetical protein
MSNVFSDIGYDTFVFNAGLDHAYSYYGGTDTL